DELPEFQRGILDSMRQPMEEHQVHIARNNGIVTYPANFMLVAAMNPCPCGYYPDRNKCRCTEVQVQKYMGHVSGPILDRIDLCVELQRLDVMKLQRNRKGKGEKKENENSAQLRRKVMSARKIQEKRFEGTKYQFNADIEASDIERFCRLGAEEQKFMEELYNTLQLSARAYHRILKVARTIADLAGEEEIKTEHLLEAAVFRPMQEYWRGM
ncbi:MAG: ATP-binding protein, partial [Eubacterium sp.]|nr:ATP-binding protein [Eubacterium sp.]